MNDNIEELLTRGVEEVIVKEHLEAALKSKKKLRVKLGIDPTSPNIHIGRAGALWKLREFQELGHKVIFIVGDFTGLIGDASDKESERPMMTEVQVKQNIKTYFEQAAKIIDPKKSEMHYNSTWLKKLGFLEIGRMADAFGLHEFEARENISKRMKAGKRVSLRELLYPIMQGYDSVAVKADVEIGGTDQRFNLLAGRVIQPLYGQEPQNILTRTLLEGTDGRKMSSSWGNVVNITEKPNDMFGKIMSVPDELIKRYFVSATRVPLQEVDQIIASHSNPRDQKLVLAREITALYHGKKLAEKAEAEFKKVFSNKELPQNMPEIKLLGNSIELLELLLKTGIESKGEARRLIEQGAVEIDSQKKTNPKESIQLTRSLVLKVGKARFYRVI
jgi:tyrosyl-tRNA synthetase